MTTYEPCPSCRAEWSVPVVSGNETRRERVHVAGCLGDGPAADLAARLESFWAEVDAPDVPDPEPPRRGCGCNRCLKQTGWPLGFPHMIVCATCGNKRCPHASDHRSACTNSNEWRPYGTKPNGVKP